jgi:hypothetical protein
MRKAIRWLYAAAEYAYEIGTIVTKAPRSDEPGGGARRAGFGDH